MYIQEFAAVDDLRNHIIDGLRRWNAQHGRPLQEPNARVEGIGDMIIVADYRPTILDNPACHHRAAPLPRRGQTYAPPIVWQKGAPDVPTPDTHRPMHG
jgi:hypothetical protein